MMQGRLYISIIALLLLPYSVLAENSCADTSNWTPGENSAWNALIDNGEFGELNTADNNINKRMLRPKFVRQILTCKSLFTTLGPKGVVLKGAIIAKTLDFRFVKIPIRFACINCRIERILAGRSDWRHQLALDGSIIMRHADFSRANFNRDFSAVGLQTGAGIKLDQITVAHDLSFQQARIKGKLSARGASIGGTLRLDGAKLGELNASGASITKQMILSGIDITRRAILDRIHIGGDLLLRTYENAPMPLIGQAPASTPPNDQKTVLNLNIARIDGRLEIASARIQGALSLDAIRVGEDIWIRDGTEITGRLNMPFARIGQNFDLSTTVLGSDVDATGAKIDGELRLGAYGSTRLTAPVWGASSRLILRNASVSAWLDSAKGTRVKTDECQSTNHPSNPWPCDIDVIGFSYARIGGLGGGDEFQRSAEWYLDWLARQQPFSLDPYRRLANYLQNNGRDAAARTVRFAGKNAQFNSSSGLDWGLLLLQKVFVGYGIFTGLVFVWMLVLIGLGAAIFSRTVEARNSEIPISIAYSIDMLLPFVQLRRRHSDIDFAGSIRFYLYFHKFMGWVCALFFVSALGGLFEV